MKKFIFLCLLVLSGRIVFSQGQPASLVTYFPAPGQYINAAGIGTPQAAGKALTTENSLVSLGSFGGYIVLQFADDCVNHPDNPYGVDFTIFGNSFSGSSEPGVVWVMKDENANGQPDDTWYEIAGSNHFFAGTIRNYSVTYFKTSGRDILWKDKKGASGVIPGNSFNLQDYYPMEQNFPDYPRDSVTFTGTLIRNFYYTSTNQEIKLAAPPFGYADSRPKVFGRDLTVPDNPYTPETEGAGGDPIDISWAIDENGNYVDLDRIHFVKIVTAGLDEAGWLGENSTEIGWIERVKPNSAITGEQNLLVVKPLPELILTGETIHPEAAYFIQGRIDEAVVSLSVEDEQVVVVNEEGMLEGRQPGSTKLHFSVDGAEQVVTVTVTEPHAVSILNDFSAVYPGDTLELRAEVTDNLGRKLDIYPAFEITNGNAGKVVTVDDKYLFIALRSGGMKLSATVEGYGVRDEVQVNVLSPDDRVKVLMSVKSAVENILPLQYVEVQLSGLNNTVENRKRDYNEAGRVNAAHAIMAGLQKAGAAFAFRDDAAAEGSLYLYKVEHDGLFSYGWGGKTQPAANARAWIVSHNGTHYLNGFDALPLTEGDTLVLYHVPDILGSWHYTRLLLLETQEGHSEFLLEQAILSQQEGIISRSQFTPLAGVAVGADMQYLTGPDGKVTVEHQQLPVVVTAGVDAVLLDENVSTGISLPGLDFRVYPNPAGNYVTIDFAAEGITGSFLTTIKLFDTHGGLLIEEATDRGTTRLDLSVLTPGLYYLAVTNGKRSLITKVIKK